MKHIENESLTGERPLFALKQARLDNVSISPGPELGESALKHSSQVEAHNCNFSGKYPFWHTSEALIADCKFEEGGRAAIWYAEDLTMRDTLVIAPKMFRQSQRLNILRSQFPHAQETLWDCSDVSLEDVSFEEADYLFMDSHNLDITGMNLKGNYSFQKVSNVVIRNSHIESKDAFWDSEDITVYDSTVIGEYLGWHSRNLKFVNCRIESLQGLCYAENLVLENCTLANSTLCFEYSNVNATINGHVESIFNPTSGSITADSIGEIRFDEHCVNATACKKISVNSKDKETA